MDGWGDSSKIHARLLSLFTGTLPVLSRECLQCCGSRRFWTGSAFDLKKKPDPDPASFNFCPKFLHQEKLAKKLQIKLDGIY
jgi:hypothetical protein